MFNTYRTDVKACPDIMEVNEHKAPTDESIRLFNEFREKAIQSIVNSGSEKLGAEFMYWDTFYLPENQGCDFMFRIHVNGKPYDGNLFFGIRMVINAGGRSVDALANEMSKKIREEVVRVVSEAISEEIFQGASLDLAKILTQLVESK